MSKRAKPDAWESRARERMEDHIGEWSEWRDGKAPRPIPFYWEVEERLKSEAVLP